MTWDAHANFAISAVATAPSPATSGTSLVVTSGHGSRFPAVPFNAVIWPTGASPDPSNAEVVRVTARSSDTLTITRAQESSSARTVVVGDQIAAAITRKTVTDIEDWASGQRRTVVNPAAIAMCTIPGVKGAGLATSTTTYASINRDHYYPVACEDSVTFDQVLLEVTTAGSAGATCRVGLYTADASWQPVALVEDFGTAAIDSTGVKTLTPAGGSRTLAPGRYLLAHNHSANTGYRTITGCPPSGPLLGTAIGTSPHYTELYVARTYAAFPSTPSAWSSGSQSGTGAFVYVVWLRVTGVG